MSLAKQAQHRLHPLLSLLILLPHVDEFWDFAMLGLKQVQQLFPSLSMRLQRFDDSWDSCFATY